MEHLTAIIVALIASSGVLITKEMIAYLKDKKERRKQKFTSGLEVQKEVYLELNTIVNNTLFDRALIISTENGGGIPSRENMVYASVLYEKHNDSVSSVQEEFQRIKADESYINMLLKLVSEHDIEQETGLMPRGLLKDYYKTDNILYSQQFYLTHTEKAFYFISLGSKSKKEDLSNPGYRRTVNSSINHLREIFKK